MCCVASEKRLAQGKKSGEKRGQLGEKVKNCFEKVKKLWRKKNNSCAGLCRGCAGAVMVSTFPCTVVYSILSRYLSRPYRPILSHANSESQSTSQNDSNSQPL
jgi:hypothetical protein